MVSHPHPKLTTVHTGEEEEETVYQTRTKLYVMRSDGGWRERGVGTVKINVRRSDQKGARIGEHDEYFSYRSDARRRRLEIDPECLAICRNVLS